MQNMSQEMKAVRVGLVWYHADSRHREQIVTALLRQCQFSGTMSMAEFRMEKCRREFCAMVGRVVGHFTGGAQ
jgi:hypothetical protein